MRYYAQDSLNKDNTKEVIKKINRFLEDYGEDVIYLVISSEYNQTPERLETVIDFRFQLGSEESYVGNHITLYEYNMEHRDKHKKVQAILDGINYDGRIVRQTILTPPNRKAKKVVINGTPIFEGFIFEYNEEQIMVSHWEHSLLFFIFVDDEEPFTYPSFVKSVPLVEVEGLVVLEE